MIRCLFILIFALVTPFMASMASTGAPLKERKWQFDGVTGTFDRESIQRGFKVYKEVCSACHSLKYLAFRNLRDLGFSEEEVKAIAASYTVKDGPDQNGDFFDRPGLPSDYLPDPFLNIQAARAANSNAFPPDLSLIVKARQDGANYIYSILTGFATPPEGMHMSENLYYNPYFETGSGQIAMPPPLKSEGQVQYPDGTDATVEQMAFDMVNFLQWVAEPEMERRKGLGIKVMIFCAVLTVFFYFAKRSLWKRLK